MHTFFALDLRSFCSFLFRESVLFTVCIVLLMIMAYGKNTKPSYCLNSAVKDILVSAPSSQLNNFQNMDDWYLWAQSSLLESVNKFPRLHNRKSVSTTLALILMNFQGYTNLFKMDLKYVFAFDSILY